MSDSIPSCGSSGSRSSWLMVQVFFRFPFISKSFRKFLVASSGIIFLTQAFPFFKCKPSCGKTQRPNSLWICEQLPDCWDRCEEVGLWACLQTSLPWTWVSELSWTEEPFDFFPVCWGHRKQALRVHGQRATYALVWCRRRGVWGLPLHVNIKALLTRRFPLQALSHLLSHQSSLYPVKLMLCRSADGGCERLSD